MAVYYLTASPAGKEIYNPTIVDMEYDGQTYKVVEGLGLCNSCKK